MEWRTNGVEETRALAKALAELAPSGAVLALDGELGAGKTAFTQGLARGLGITEPVTSPTFTLVQEYEGPRPLYHFDVYRLPNAEAFWEMGGDEYLGRGLCVLEWAEQVRTALPEDTLWIRMERVDDDTRLVQMEGAGWERLLEALAARIPPAEGGLDA